MKNAKCSRIIIDMKSAKDAKRLTKALQKFAEAAVFCKGSALFVSTNGDLEKIVEFSHRVDIARVYHSLEVNIFDAGERYERPTERPAPSPQPPSKKDDGVKDDGGSALHKAKVEYLKLKTDIMRIKDERLKLREEKGKEKSLDDLSFEKVGGGNKFSCIKDQRKKNAWVEYLKLAGEIMQIKNKQFDDEILKLREEKEKEMSLVTFLCENCGEVHQVPAGFARGKVVFKCCVCHQVNQYDPIVK